MEADPAQRWSNDSLITRSCSSCSSGWQDWADFELGALASLLVPYTASTRIAPHAIDASPQEDDQDEVRVDRRLVDSEVGDREAGGADAQPLPPLPADPRVEELADAELLLEGRGVRRVVLDDYGGINLEIWGSPSARARSAFFG